jgi:hypothetical protein
MPKPATWIACLALAVALGGTAYAAVTLPAGSVGTKQLKNGAVTKQKIAKKTIAGLRGKAGPAGQTGPPGPPGAAGPGATSTETILPNDAALHTVLSADGLAVKASCSSEEVKLALVPTTAGGTVDFSGTSSAGTTLHVLNGSERSQIEILVKEASTAVDFDVVARDTATGPAFSAVDAHLESTCRAWAMVTPSASTTAG